MQPLDPIVISNAKKALVHDHIDHYLEHALREGSGNVDEMVRDF